MRSEARDLYLLLLKRSLCYTTYDEPPVPAEIFWSRRGYLKRWIAAILARLLRPLDARFCINARYSREDVESGRVWPLQAYSMIGLRRMDNLQACVESVLRDGIPGDFIETGVWRGGACILIRGILEVDGVRDRRVFVADSFRGLPPPDAVAHPADEGDTHHQVPFLAVSREQVAENFRRFDLLDDRVVFVEGWFKDTLPDLPTSALAVIRLDGDMYGSTIDALNHLYPRLSRGGFCIIDDFMIGSCRRAVEDYRRDHSIQEPIQDIDGWGVYWRKA